MSNVYFVSLCIFIIIYITYASNQYCGTIVYSISISTIDWNHWFIVIIIIISVNCVWFHLFYYLFCSTIVLKIFVFMKKMISQNNNVLLLNIIQFLRYSQFRIVDQKICWWIVSIKISFNWYPNIEFWFKILWKFRYFI